MKKTDLYKQTASFLAVLGNPVRVRIISAIGSDEVCVCHLEAVLKKRQAYISQHLMALRDQGILETRREGKYIFYRLANLQVLDFVKKAGLMAGVKEEEMQELQPPAHVESCICPHCTGELKEKERG